MIISNYVIVEKIAEAPQAAVYKAYHKKNSDRLLILKILKQGSLSVLCLPMIKQSRMIGILYLENRLSDAVFTFEKTQMTELLTSQATISLENARLVNEMMRAEDRLKHSLEEKEALVKDLMALKNREACLEQISPGPVR